MSLLDLAFLFVILVFAFQGFRNGIVREVLGIAGLVVAMLVAVRYMDPLGDMLGRFLEQSRELLELWAAVILFSAVFTLALSVALLIRKMLEAVRLNMINRLFGFFFGGVKSAIAIALFMLFLAGLELPSEETRRASFLYPKIMRIVPNTFQLLALVFPGAAAAFDRFEEMLGPVDPEDPLPISD